MCSGTGTSSRVITASCQVIWVQLVTARLPTAGLYTRLYMYCCAVQSCFSGTHPGPCCLYDVPAIQHLFHASIGCQSYKLACAGQHGGNVVKSAVAVLPAQCPSLRRDQRLHKTDKSNPNLHSLYLFTRVAYFRDAVGARHHELLWSVHLTRTLFC